MIVSLIRFSATVLDIAYRYGELKYTRKRNGLLDSHSSNFNTYQPKRSAPVNVNCQ